MLLADVGDRQERRGDAAPGRALAPASAVATRLPRLRFRVSHEREARHERRFRLPLDIRDSDRYVDLISGLGIPGSTQEQGEAPIPEIRVLDKVRRINVDGSWTVRALEIVVDRI